MKLRFWKMTGAGNDFVVIGERPRGRAGAALARRLCDRRFGVGADGLLSVTRGRARPRIEYWNADGSSAFCGNGTRCAGLWAAARGLAKGPRFVADTIRGPLEIRLTGKERAEVSMPAVRGLKTGLRLKALDRTWTVHFVDTGVPHAVVFVPSLDAVPVRELGRALRFHRAFGRAGANADFVSARGGRLSIRTYERGVEDETLACGTGVVAAAAVARALGKAGDSVPVTVRGGATLRVSFGAEGPRLEGPGLVVFSGEADA